MLGICRLEEGCMLEHDHHRIRTAPSGLATAPPQPNLDAYSTLYHTGAAARWRRRQDDYFSYRNTTTSGGVSGSALSSTGSGGVNPQRLSGVRHRSMEEVHGVDVSWLHHPHKKHGQGQEQQSRKQPAATSKPVVNRKPVGTPEHPPAQSKSRPSTDGAADRHPAPAVVTPPAPADTLKDTTTALPSTPTPSSNGAQATAKSTPKRPGLMGRVSSAKGGEDGKTGGRRSSWLNNISSKFGSSSQTATLEKTPPASSQPPRQAPSNGPPAPATNGAPSALPTHHEEAEEQPEPYTPSKPKESSFFSNLTRRLSSASTSSMPKAQPGSGGVCPRKVLNVDPNRPRVLVPEMDPNKLRKVSFCVDVEIAGRPQYYEEDDGNEEERMKRRKDAKLKERAEGEALKRPQALEDEKEKEGEVKMDAKATKMLKKESSSKSLDEDDANLGASPPDGEGGDHASRKKEKKKKSEEERKERKEKRRKKAEENGCIPVELTPEEEDASAGSSPPQPAGPMANGTSDPSKSLDIDPPVGSIPNTPVPQPGAPRQDKPTTDPVRIYRRCCQLRETPILKRITEQLMAPTCTAPFEPGVVSCLDLSGSRLQTSDVVTLGDWLAVVPVKNIRFEDADLTDEGVRCILAGLLAAKRPEPTKRRSLQPRHRQGAQVKQYTERSGIVEKITFKNNPRLTRLSWKYISLFIYMCRSLKAIDLSMNQFPDTLPASAHVTPTKSPQSAPKGEGRDTDAAEIFYKCLSERLGGSRLEELIVSECDLSAGQIRKIVDGAIICGISRLGLADNRLDDEGLEYVLHYVRSGICKGLDLGGNDLRGRLGKIAEAITQKKHLPCWGMSLAGCNLNTSDLKALFPALVKLPDFRFVDLSHNRDLCTRDNGTISLFRRYMSQFKDLKRIHLADVGMSPKQAIALADCLPDGPRLAHLNILENPMLSALSHATDEGMQEEACALYASLMAAVRVSSTLICIDIDVPGPENSEVVKALAKQVVAYSLRNMEQFAIAEVTGQPITTANATAKLTEPHGGEKKVKDITVPDVLWHLVGHVEGSSENHDNDPPGADEDYIVGGTGVVKALQYVLGEKAQDLRRDSAPGTPLGSSGAMTPSHRPGSSAGLPSTEEQRGKAKKMSVNLLGSARKIRQRLQPALVNEATAGDELAYRRLQFLDNTLQSMIQRFEEEYPEVREAPPASPRQPASLASSLQSDPKTDLSLNTQATEFTNNASDDEEDDRALKSRLLTMRRHGSEVSLASRAQTLEEGRLHRLGQHLRREIVDSPTQPSFPSEGDARLRALGDKIEAISGAELKGIVEHEGWETVLRKVGGNYDDLRRLQEMDPSGWEQFKESQLKARANVRADETSVED